MDDSFTDNRHHDAGPDPTRRPRPTNENPNFVRDYFAASRLHFIGSFRARFEAMMGKVARRLSVHPSTLLLPPAAARPPRPGVERVIVHVDMDCFFASVAVAANPALAGRPIAVCHARVAADGSRTAGSGEISSCSYEARAQGVRAGMFFHKALELCPTLVGVPYDFPAYERVSVAIYARFFSIPGAVVEACSVDEAYLDITDVANVDPEKLVAELRAQIFADNGCHASAGIGPSRLLARLATKRAKPDGQLRVRMEQALEFVAALRMEDLPGVGWRTGRRLAEMGIKSCAQLLAMPLSRLQAEFGEKQGRGFYDAVRGVDDRPVQPMKPRKSIGAEASWGVRFDASPEDHVKCVKFINDLATEVASRVVAAGALGTKVLYKAYKKIENGKPHKYLGHGPCEIFTRSAKLVGKVDAENLATLLAEACHRMHAELKIPNNQFRGVGIQLTDLSFESFALEGKHSVSGGSTSRIDLFLKRSSDRNLFSHKSLKRKLLEYDAANAKRIRANFGSSQQQTQIQDLEKKDRDVQDTRPQHEQEIENEEIEVVVPENVPAKDVVEKHSSPGAAEIPGDWDSAVFAALPAEIRDELLANHLQARNAQQPNRSQASGRNADHSGRGEASGAVHRRQGKAPVGVGVGAGAGGQRGGRSRGGKRGKRGPVQVTMTQFAQIAKLKSHGHPILNASQFEEKRLGECIEMAADLHDAGKGKRNVFPSEANARQFGTNNQDETKHGKDSPAISSSSEEDVEVAKDMATMIKEGSAGDGGVFVEESVAEIASDLQEWMVHVGGNIRSAHIELLRSRLFELLRLHKLTRVCSEIRTMRVFADDLKDTEWPVVFNKLVADTQRECRKIHGFTLQLEGL